MNRRYFIKSTTAAGASGLFLTKLCKSNESEKIFQGQSFIDFLQKYGEKNPPAMLYKDGQDIKVWQKGFREEMTRLRGPVPERVGHQIDVIEQKQLEGYKRQLVRFSVSEISDGIAYILIPDNIKEEVPGIVALHGHAEFGIQSICGVKPGYSAAYALEAVQSGYVVIAPAWWGWFGQDAHLSRVGKRDRCNVIQMAASMYGFNVLDLHIQLGQAAVDAISQLSQVNPNRIGCIGNSYGGRTAMWLTIFEDRIKACVPSGCMNRFRERSLKLSSCAIQTLPGVLQYGDVAELFGLIAPRPMQLQAGEGDGLITPKDRDDIKDFVQNVYSLLDVEEKFDYVLHDKGHSLQWAFAEMFLGKHL
jgi:hypothetical protein